MKEQVCVEIKIWGLTMCWKVGWETQTCVQLRTLLSEGLIWDSES